jgi:oligopeptide transport system ATP-binding protein
MLFEIDSISKAYPSPSNPRVKALSGVSLCMGAGEAVGLVGESGSGKSTLIKCALKLEAPDAGSITYDGMDVLSARGSDLRRFRREVQLVFQDPYSSLNPRMTVEELVGEGLVIHGLESSAARRRDRVVEMLERVGLGSADLRAYPRSFSGGQRQRIAIARAVAIGPKVLVCDEPVSALDVSVRAQVMNLLSDMRRDLGLTILFIAHDLSIVRFLCERVYVLNRGEIVEEGPRQRIFDAPTHPYTVSLLAAVPEPDPALARARRAQRKAAQHAATTTGGAP